ncbi:MAG: chemotaxis protein CheB [Elainella sp. C42_A2020_010]|nr:chemotaxis protein CheB [Elainella sp. C42_A2020_010]RNJ68527.1 MAG: chemotaxis protein CheB [Leptolyngbya sp. IPPAS B-1204]
MPVQVISSSQQWVYNYFPNIAYRVVGIAASLGGLQAMATILSELPAGFPAAIVIVQHLSPHYPSHLARILKRHTVLRVKQAEAGELLRPGTIYTAIPNQHLLMTLEGTLHFSSEERINFCRPAADLMLKSIASVYQRRAIAVILTGRGCDGALGAAAIKQYGGIVIAQNKATSRCFSMPNAAINTGCVDWILPVEAIAPRLINLLMSDSMVS